MVYLARTEDTNEAVIEWKVDALDKGLTIKTVQLRCDSKLYEDAKVSWEFVTNNGEWKNNIWVPKLYSNVEFSMVHRRVSAGDWKGEKQFCSADQGNTVRW